MGLGLLILVGLGIALTGLPAVVVLIGVSVLGAIAGLATGAIALPILSALPGRLLSLLENDLLQALPLYVLTGLLLDRLPVADALYRASLALLPRKPSAPLASGMALGALLGPMNGSVGASVLALSRVVAPRLSEAGVPPAKRFAAVAVASTLGVVIPPSLVLIFLGDAMLSAHTIAVTQTGRNDRVINTQDVFHGALVPAAIFLVLCVTLAWVTGRGIKAKAAAPAPRLTLGEGALAGMALGFLLVLLGGVAAGYFYAVEAAAMAAFVLLAAGIVTGRLPGKVMRDLLADVMATTGALFGLLIAATTLTLILRLLGTDRLVSAWVVSLPGNDVAITAIILLVIGLTAFVLDAFEIIFVIIPIVIPPLLIRVADASWVAVMVLLTLQTSFLLPPFGYALLMLRGRLREATPMGAISQALAPFLIAQWLVLGAVLLWPQLVHVGEKADSHTRGSAVPTSAEDLQKRFNEMWPQLPDLPPPN
jgi:TRAP-type mannitol/chloroaromatic compound transport system permease large subunit